MTEVKIDFIGHKGDGVAHLNGNAVYVPFTLEGETLIIQGSGPRRDILEIKQTSSDRIEPICKHFGTCGGCQLQHMQEQTYLKWKMKLVTEPLSRVGITQTPEAIISFNDASRRKCVFNAQRTHQGMQLGFSEKARNEIVAIETCPILVSEINERLPLLRDLVNSVPTTKNPIRISVLSTENGLDISIEDAKPLSAAERQILIKKTVANKFTRLTINDEVLIKTAEPHIKIASTIISPPPAAFVQALKEAEDTMTDIVADFLKGCKQVADLYCGIGTFALKLAENSQVYAVEESQMALESLDQAWRQTGGILKQVKTEKRNLERRPVTFGELKKMDGLVFDPPRAGAELQCKQIAKSRVKKVAAVSCNPTTLAVDLEILLASGFKIKRIIPIDQFKYTPHVEVVVLLER